MSPEKINVIKWNILDHQRLYFFEYFQFHFNISFISYEIRVQADENMR